jgi:hypothetical protein
VGEGPYCVYCNRILQEAELVPMKGRRKVAAQPWTYGQEIARCKYHVGRGSVVFVRS